MYRKKCNFILVSFSDLFFCQICSQELMTAGSLHNHRLRHEAVRSFMCRFCAKLFLTAGQLKVHERIHTHDKAFVCEVSSTASRVANIFI